MRARSFDIGCRRVTERFLSADPLEDEEAARPARGCASASTSSSPAKGFPDRWHDRGRGHGDDGCEHPRGDGRLRPDRVHGSWVSLDELRDVNARLSAIPLAERERVVGLDPKRAPVICAGLMILEEVMAAGGFGGFTVSESDILQGLVLEAARLRSRSSFRRRGGGTRTHNPKRRILSPLRMPIPPRPPLEPPVATRCVRTVSSEENGTII